MKNNGTILMPPDDKVITTYQDVHDSIREKVERPTADFVQSRIQRQVDLEDLKRWAVTPDGQLRPDETPDTSRSLGEAAWSLISSITP